jgi:hypothetical protein
MNGDVSSIDSLKKLEIDGFFNLFGFDRILISYLEKSYYFLNIFRLGIQSKQKKTFSYLFGTLFFSFKIRLPMDSMTRFYGTFICINCE